MEVKNYYVSDLINFKEQLIRELILNNISYVCVGNEIHYEDKIIRLFGSGKFKENKPLKIKEGKPKEKINDYYERQPQIRQIRKYQRFD